VTTGPDAAIEPDLEVEARRLLAEIAARDLSMRLIGGMAIRLTAADRLNPAFARPIADLDFVVSKGDRRAAETLLGECGYLADEQFNALNGAHRLLYRDPGNDRQLDIFVGSFQMCHELPVAERLDARPDVLPVADLLMTKLQIVHLNAKDRGDLYALLDSSPLEDFELDRIAGLAGDDWGLHHTFALNLRRLREGLPELPIEAEHREVIGASLAAIETAIDDVPKTRRWRLRDRIGERKRWYEEPEEVDRDV
jgi:hypothetical protein